MHRGRNRSRKPVESQTMAQSLSTVTSLTVSGSTTGGGGTGTASFQSLPLHAFGGTQVTALATGQSNYHVESIPYGIPRKDYSFAATWFSTVFIEMTAKCSEELNNFRVYLVCVNVLASGHSMTGCPRSQGIKPDAGGHSFISEALGSNRDTWPLMQSRVSSFPQSKSDGNPVLLNDYPQHSFFSDFNSGETVKPEGQSLRPFFDEWPKTRDTWSALEDDRSNQTSFSTTQLSISIPMASSDFSTTGSHSPHGEFQTP
ncbi:hypothetical protein Gorai_003274 [Gossypium raimondii]|uniref:Growth-regulating factor n=1 Tax=Gossypium raimondii TaxID=29730 RepID=A0A7J8QNE8_GOSRA|nr:hypothetical protein [Gossypium raimondii]